MKNNKGFTLVELLVVIAIIGILSTVAVVNLNSARDKAKLASVQGSLSSIIPAAIICQDDGLNLTYTGATVCDDSSAPVAGQVICVGSSGLWPTLPSGYTYSATCSSTFGSNTYDYTASGDGNTIACDQDGCQTS